MRILFLFLDGVGLGGEDPAVNPFARAEMPVLQDLLGGRRLTAAAAPFYGDRVVLLGLDAGLGVPGLPQSATGQAVLLTGINVPAELGYHYGPKPNPAVAAYLTGGETLFSWARAAGKRAALLNAYPPRYFEGIRSGKRLHSSIPLAVTSAGYTLFTQEDLASGRALSADFTGQGWRSLLGIQEAPVLSPPEAGRALGRLARECDFAMFEYWASDYAGHKQDMAWATSQLATFDQVLAGLLGVWDLEADLILVTSDHGNMEDLSARRHTGAPVPGLLIGRAGAQCAHGLSDLTGIASRVKACLED